MRNYTILWHILKPCSNHCYRCASYYQSRMGLHVFNHTVFVIIVLDAWRVVFVVNPWLYDIFLYCLINLSSCTILSCSVGLISSILCCIGRYFGFNSHVGFCMVLYLYVLSDFDVVGTSMSFCPVSKSRRIHVHCMVGLAFFHRRIYSWELRSFVDISPYFLWSFNHVFILHSIVDIVFNHALRYCFCAHYAPFCLDSRFRRLKSSSYKSSLCSTLVRTSHRNDSVK